MPNQKLVFQLVRVACGDETMGANLEKAGHDQMWISGVGISANGTVQKREPFAIASNFDDGDIKEFDPPVPLFELAIPEAGGFPKAGTVALLLAEWKDGNEHRAATDELHKRLTAAAAAQKADLWALAGTALITVLGDIVKNQAEGLLNQFAKDKLFQVQQVTQDVASADFRWGDGTKLSPEITLNFREHKASYYVTFFWEVRNA